MRCRSVKNALIQTIKTGIEHGKQAGKSIVFTAQSFSQIKYTLCIFLQILLAFRKKPHKNIREHSVAIVMQYSSQIGKG